MPKEARLIAAVLAVVAVVVGALVVFSGDDDGSEVNASDTTSATPSSTTDATTATTTSTAAPTTSAAATTLAPDPGADAPADSPPPPTSGAPATSAGPTVTVAPGSVAISEAADWQGGLQADTVRARFDAADTSDDLCTQLVALTSLPDLNTLPELPKDDLAEYFTRWQALADRAAPQTEGTMAQRLQAARAALLTIEQVVNESDGTFNEAAVDQILGSDGSELTQLLAFFVLVADECPAPFAG